jgi:hypothetical protein
MDFTPIGPFPGVYLLIINGKKYIGSSKNINKRITEHKRLLRNNIHYNKLVQEAYNVSNNVEHYCIAKCNEAELFTKEQEFLDKELPELNISLSAANAVLSKERVQEKQGGARNHMAKITLEQAVSVVHARNEKMTLKEIAEYTEVPYIIVVSICSADNWKTELETFLPIEYGLLRTNRKALGIENKGKVPPSNRLFNDTTLLDVLNMLLSGSTLQVIADKYNTSKTVISSIKNNKVYKKDILRLLSEEQYKKFIGN